MGITSGNDGELIDYNKDSIIKRFSEKNLKVIDYRIFDKRYIR